jgi:maltose alpha-D-glucosyltransferase/alpha-amylase
MALAQGSRRPIEWVLARTPALPPGCQWGTFLRNHDELTLEMVTPEERTFLWCHYAPEPRMRLNLGIRRRLAPLLGNDPRRLQAAHSLLLTLIGSPFLYYGDEIGMGDDLRLDDRDGVRTPMQWDDSPNAGFSTAPAERLYAPVIDSPPYGYTQVNVAAQESDPGSLLRWLRSALHLRRQHPAMGRGEVRLLSLDKLTVLAHERRYEAERLLFLHNLSAKPQDAVWKLEGASGLVDLFGGETLSRTAAQTYRCKLPAYGYRWFQVED